MIRLAGLRELLCSSPVQTGRRLSLKGLGLLMSSGFLLSACTSGQDDFKFLDEGSSSSEITSAVQIIDYTPKSNPVIVTNSGTITFAVTVGSGAGNNLTYAFSLDGNVVQSGPNGFFDLNAASVGAGAHTLDVNVTNGVTQDSHRFNLQKNTPPVIDSTSPPAAGNVVSCGGGALILNVQASDVDGDNLSFVWKVNSGISPALFSSIVSDNSQSTATFAPPCTLSGSNVVTVEVSDSYDTISYSWAVSVVNPLEAEITSFTPSTSPVIIPSTGSQLFSISATGKAPLVYSWLLNGTPIGGANSSFYTLTAGSVPVGPHTLTARVEDFDSSDERIFNVVRNAPPVLSNPIPAQDDVKLNYQSVAQFRIDASDENGDNLTYTWTLNGSISGLLTDSPTPEGSQAVFAPTEAQVGTHIVRVRVSDGTEHTDHQWTVDVNYFSDACNTLEPGRICTVIGRVGFGSGLTPEENPGQVVIHPRAVVSDGLGGLFISDPINHLIWYYNRSGATVTRLGVDVEPGQIVALVGNGAPGSTPNGSVGSAYKLDRPEGLAWDPDTESLFIAEYNKRVISRINSSGAGSRVICSGANADTPNSGPATGHGCREVTSLALDPVARILYMGRGRSGSGIRAFDISDSNPDNWTGAKFISGGGGANGAIGGGASAHRVWTMTTDSQGVLYWVNGNQNCRLRVANTTGSSISFFGGAVSVPAGHTADLTTASCGNGGNGPTYTRAQTQFSSNNNASKGLVVVESSPGVVDGWLASNHPGHKVYYLNNTGSEVTVGGTAIAPYEAGRVTWRESGYNGDLVGNLTRVSSPWGLAYLPGEQSLVVADYSNSRLRALDLGVSAGQFTTWAGEDFKYGNSGDAGQPANTVLLRDPRGLAVDQSGQVLYLADSGNGRVRALDLLTGWAIRRVGQGNNNALAGDPLAQPHEVYFGGSNNNVSSGPRRLFALPNGNLLISDRNNNAGTNRSCTVRLYNRLSSAFSFLGLTIPSNRVAPVAGSWALGCGDHSEGALATDSALFSPDGVIYDGTNMYIAPRDRHCLLQVNPGGVLSTLVGNCTSAGYQDGLLSDSNVRLRNPTDLALDPEYGNDGNFFVIDAHASQNSYLRYVNQRDNPVTISGVVIPAQSIGTVFTAGNHERLNAVAAFDNQYCFSRGQGTDGPHNVVCRNRADDLGNATLRAGSSDASPIAGGAPLGEEQEGVPSASATLYEPIGLAFDAEGNLYISERLSHQVRKVRRWW